MNITLKLRENSAYFTPNKILYADNENLEITVRHKGRIVNRGFLIFNDKLYALADNVCVIPHDAINTVNTCELQDRKGDDVIHRWRVENLYSHKYNMGAESDARLVAEREFYTVTAKQLSEEISVLQSKICKLEKAVDQLENGKFRLFKFKTEENKK
nr:MAG TPA: hypothetical protein [Caudoviricetes sp.]